MWRCYAIKKNGTNIEIAMIERQWLVANPVAFSSSVTAFVVGLFSNVVIFEV